MTRWHAASCIKPDVFVDGDIPRCRTCDTYPDIPRLLGQRDTSSAPWTVPPDEAIGEMSLYWPECVPYMTKEQAESRFRRGAERDPSRARNEPRSEVGHVNLTPMSLRQSLSAFPSIYERPLRTDEFRVLCLTATKDVNSPIHVTLETHQDDNCPEYETASYAWGGEEGDNEAQLPVYVGEYWDLLFQTKNCWFLLQYLRPNRGERIIWVDAICIDQSNNPEREVQVAKMGNIFQRCTRVVVFLGRDVSGPRPHQVAHQATYRPRYDLHEINERLPDSDMSFHKLLQLRYFSRVWVIQELVLAPIAIIPILGAEYIASNLTPTYLASKSLEWKFDDTSAPWMKYVASRGLSFEEDLFKILQHTWIAQATDPRDKVFGILGLIQGRPASQGLKPNYSISLLHTFVGIMAHLILNLKRVELFLKASARSSKPSRLSWLPDWEVHNTLRHPFEWPTGDIEGFDPRFHLRATERISIRKKAIADRTDYESVKRIGHGDKSYTRMHEYGDTSNEEKREAKSGDDQDGRYGNHGVWFIFSIHSQWPEAWRGQMNTHFVIDAAEDHDKVNIPWDFQPHIDSHTAELSIHLLHLFKVFTKPIRSHLTSSTCLVRFPGRDCTLYIRTANVPLHCHPGLDPTDVFALMDKASHHVFILVMRGTQIPGSYRLIQSYPCYDLYLKVKLTAEESRLLVPQRIWISDTLHKNLHSVLQRAILQIGDLDARPERADKGWNHDSGLFPLFLDKPWAIRDILPVFQGAIDKNRGLKSRFLDRYMDYLFQWGTDFQPRVEHGFLELTINFSDWFSFASAETFNQNSLLSLFMVDPIGLKCPAFWEWKAANQSIRTPFGHQWREVIDHCDQLIAHKDEKILVRVSLDGILFSLTQTKYYQALSSLSPCCRLTGETELSMLLRGPKFEDRFLACIDWPEVVREEFKATGVTQRVNIV